MVKHTVKDSVFTSLFKEKRYLIQLYRALHPEDTKTTEDDLKDVTVSNVLVDDIYTTGSTLDAVALELKRHGVGSVYFITLCIGEGL